MDIYELENLRKNTSKEIDNLKPFVILGTFIIPLLVFLLYLSNVSRNIESWASLSCFFGFYPMLFSLFKLIDINKFGGLKMVITMFVTIFLLKFIIENGSKNAPYFTVFIITIISVVLSYLAVMRYIKDKKSKIYNRSFKMKFLYPYIKQLGYNYDPEGNLNFIHIHNSKLFGFNKPINSNDRIYGEFDGVEFEMCDVVFHQNFQSDQAYEIWGIFFYATFNKKINSKTFIFPINRNSDNTKNLKQITMDNSEFNAKFSVYSNDLQNAMYILSPAFMKRLLDLKRRLNFPISVSFAGDKIYIFLDTGKDNFEPDIDKSVLRANPAFTIKRELSHFLSIVKTLNLNTRIWKV
ncbi:DUF3137 domain-containing protein [Campylobacter sp. JMF_02 ED1]|uniref:DUF3137 domain-containing protein n=1 Tax=unclassified Campylobacter TaxID=2593542 RepID=UPI0022E9B695|nr:MULTISPECIES: DUF3137 domain-containing protein [unclassified Campylobacter]MDA3048842.1 DUF3137 domain-containing protein [Campylobacter sp. JMF_15 NE4]MDA3050447.1 DUF3137 domain-containing protein [Campylobacter sp. JMF_02 ED1]